MEICGVQGSTAHQSGCEKDGYLSLRASASRSWISGGLHCCHHRHAVVLFGPVPAREWERIERDVQNLPTLNPAVRRFQRLVLGYASDLDLDSSGRILLPGALREYAHLEKRVVLVGQGNKLELWSESLWEAECEAALAADEGDLPAELMELKL